MQSNRTEQLSAEKRVVHIISQLLPGGVERRTLDLIRLTGDKGFEHYVCLTSGRRGTLDSEYSAAGAKLIYLNIKSLLFSLRFMKFLKFHDIDSVHSNIMYSSGFILLLAKLSGVKNRIAHFRSDGTPASQQRKFRRIQRFVMRTLINFSATQIIGLTPQNLEMAWRMDWRNDDRCKVVSNGVHVTENFQADQPSEFHTISEETIILHVGRGDLPTKNRSKAIRIFSEYLKINSNSHLFFIGRDGISPAQAQTNLIRWSDVARAEGILDRVHFLGEKDDVFPYMLHGDALLFTSSLEGLPGVVIEALSCGLPVISSDVPGAVFISEHTEGVYILGKGATESDWATELQNVDFKLSNELRIQHVRRFVGTPFDINFAASKYQNLWR